MFTGIVTDVGRVRTADARGAAGERRLVIETSFDTAAIALGASIACSGPCLTVVETGAGWFAVDVSAETLRHTTIGGWAAGTRVNLERSLKLGDELGGHLVMGHVDGVARLANIAREGDSLRLDVAPPPALMPLIAPKGSVSLDGVSLTVNEVGVEDFAVNIIPHTQHATTLGTAMPGAALNLEIDVLARYVARLQEAS
jgi:riboflavin synthase